MRVLSLGAGVQSSALLLMACEGELTLDCAIFADTQWEPKAVYRHLDWLEAYAVDRGITVYRVSAGDLRADALSPDHNFASMPLYVRHTDGSTGMLRRQCTREYKITPIQRKVRQLGASARAPATLVMGISLDEFQRMRDSRVKYIQHEYPLVDRRLKRSDCLAWMQAHGFPEPPKSACIGCPFRRDAQWADLQREPGEWEDAVAFDEAIRSGQGQVDSRPAFIHRSATPLRLVDLRSAQERGQLDMFAEDCLGHCGV